MKTATMMTPADEARIDVTAADHCALPCYVVVTPARNEAPFIEKTMESMIRQTVLPLKWVIVDDGSTDETAAIVSKYLSDYPWIDMICREKRNGRNFAGKVNAFYAGLERLQDIPWEFVSNLDGDISFDPDHFEFLLGRCVSDPKLGVVGTTFREEGFDLARDVIEWETHVGGQCQMFRRQCFEEIGGYVPVATGGVDWVAVITARMKGWKTRSFAEREFYHHRPMGTAGGGPLTSAYRYGRKDYCIGSHPLWEAARVAHRMGRRPYILSGITLAAGYGWAWMNREPRAVSKELIQFHRREQMTKLKRILKRLLG